MTPVCSPALAAAYAEAGRFDQAKALFQDRFFPREEGGTNVRHLQHNLDAVANGPLEAGLGAAIRDAFARQGADWRGLV